VDAASLLLSLPADLEVWLIVGYVAVVLAGARLSETLARIHFERARRYAEAGFEYDADADHYRCPQGERLALQMVEEASRLAVYRAPASSCNGCALKPSCTPHDEGRHLYRPLATWAETDIGRFHRRLSLLMVGIASVFSLGGLYRWLGQPGTGLLLAALAASVASITRDLRAAWAGPDPDVWRPCQPISKRSHAPQPAPSDRVMARADVMKRR
jgi:hypothetical protein